MAVLLEGINIPEGNPITINIYRDGTWVNAYTTEDGNAIEVPEPHGDLIDRDAARESIKPWSPEDERNGCTFDTVKKLMHTMLDRAPTIVPAEESGA